MTESYTVNIESAPLAEKVTPDALDAYASALFADRRIAGPAPSANLAINTVGLTTSIDAKSPDHAFMTTQESFLEAAKIARLGRRGRAPAQDLARARAPAERESRALPPAARDHRPRPRVALGRCRRLGRCARSSARGRQEVACSLHKTEGRQEGHDSQVKVETAETSHGHP